MLQYQHKLDKYKVALEGRGFRPIYFGKPWTEIEVLGLLREILEIVEVAHREQVIHKISSLPTSFAASQMES